MKAIEFMIAHGAICKHYGGVMKGCTKNGEQCPLKGIDCDLRADMTPQDAEQMQALVDKWLNRNGKTNADKFKEIFGMELMEFWTLCDVNAEQWAKQKYEEQGA